MCKCVMSEASASPNVLLRQAIIPYPSTCIENDAPSLKSV